MRPAAAAVLWREGELVGVTFGSLVRRGRQAAWLTQEQLSDKSGLSTRAIQAIERDQVRRPRRETVRLLADALGLRGSALTEFEMAARPGSAVAMVGGHRCATAELIDCLARRLRTEGREEAAGLLARLRAALGDSV